MGLTKKERREQKQNVSIDGVFENKQKAFSIKKLLADNWKFLLLVLSLVTLLYANGMNADFVSDDYASITQNPIISSVDNIWSSKNFVGATLTIVAKIFGIASPLPFHLPSLFAFWVVLILAFAMLAQIVEVKVAKGAVLMFGLLPVNVEAITWISGRPYLYGAIGLLSSVLILMRYLETKNRKLIFYLVLCFIATYFGIHVRVINILPVLLLFLICFGHVKRGDLLKLSLGTLGAIVVALIIFAPAISSRIGAVNSSVATIWDYFYQPWYQYPTAIAKYLQLILIPVDLTLYHTMYTVPLWLNWITFLVFIACGVYFWKKNKVLTFGLFFIFAASAGSLLPLKVGWLVAERYVFIGALGFCLVGSIVFWNIYEKIKYVSLIPVFILLSLYSYRIYIRNIDWQTNHNLWVNTCLVSPNSHNAWNNIGDDYDKLKQYDNAIKGFSQSTIVKPDYSDAFHNRANILFKVGRYDLARQSYMTALQFNPALYQSRMSLIQVSITEGNIGQAVNDSFELVKQRPGDVMAHYALGFSLAKSGRNDEAKLALRQALQINPGFVQATELLKALGP